RTDDRSVERPTPLDRQSGTGTAEAELAQAEPPVDGPDKAPVRVDAEEDVEVTRLVAAFEIDRRPGLLDGVLDDLQLGVLLGGDEEHVDAVERLEASHGQVF